MVRLVFIGLLCGFFFLFFPEEENDAQPLAWNLTGEWMAEDSASIELIGDGTCLVRNLDLSRFISLDSCGVKQISMEGVWDYDSFFNRFPVNDPDNKNLLILIKEPISGLEYDLFFSVKGDHGIFKNKEPWVLYTPEGKWLNKNAYEFRKKLRDEVCNNSDRTCFSRL